MAERELKELRRTCRELEREIGLLQKSSTVRSIPSRHVGPGVDHAVQSSQDNTTHATAFSTPGRLLPFSCPSLDSEHVESSDQALQFENVTSEYVT